MARFLPRLADASAQTANHDLAAGGMQGDFHNDSADKRPTMTKKKITCVYCNETFHDPELMREHMRTHAKSRKKLACSFCPRSFDDPEELSHHRLAHLKDKNVFVSQQSSSEAVIGDIRENVDAETQEPSTQEPSTREGVIDDTSVDSKVGCKVEESVGEIEIAAVPPPLEIEPLIKIENPEEPFDPLDSSTSWILPHSSILDEPSSSLVPLKTKDFICPDCEVGFDTLNKLAAHAKRCHPFVCRDCHRTFKWLDDLNVHRQVYYMKPCYRWSRCPKLAFSHQKVD